MWWTWYAFGGKLPDRYREWVMHDVTCRTWALRHVARSLVQVAPVALLLLVVLGFSWITLWMSKTLSGLVRQHGGTRGGRRRDDHFVGW
jgi:hypothetical protein